MTRQEKKTTDYTGVIIAAILVPVYLIFYLMGKEEMGRSVFIVLGMTMLAIRIRWDLRNRFWFWTVVVLVLAAHIPLLFYVHWPECRLSNYVAHFCSNYLAHMSLGTTA